MDLDSLNPPALGALLRAGYEPAAARVTAALQDASGRVTVAAQALGVPVSTLHRWLRLPALQGAPRLGREAGARQAREARLRAGWARDVDS
jgi:hypothetical protein